MIKTSNTTSLATCTTERLMEVMVLFMILSWNWSWALWISVSRLTSRSGNLKQFVTWRSNNKGTTQIFIPAGQVCSSSRQRFFHKDLILGKSNWTGKKLQQQVSWKKLELGLLPTSWYLILMNVQYFSSTLLTNEQFLDQIFWLMVLTWQFLDQIFWLMVPTWQFPRIRLHCFSTADLVTRIPLGQHELQPGKSGHRIWAAQLLVGFALQ